MESKGLSFALHFLYNTSMKLKPILKAINIYIEHRIGNMIGFDPPMIFNGKKVPVTLKRLISNELGYEKFRKADKHNLLNIIDKGRRAREAYITEILGAEYIGTQKGRDLVNKAMQEKD